MIKTKSDLIYYIQQDRKMNKRPPATIKTWFRELFVPDFTMKYLLYLRKAEYYHNCQCGNIIWRLINEFYYGVRYRRIGVKLGYTMYINCFGPGLSLPHIGTIVVNPNTRIGSNCRIQTSVNIGASAGGNESPQIGNNVYIGPGAILFGGITIANNVTIGANATVNKSCELENVVLAGSPAQIIKDNYPSWIEFNKVN